MGIKVSQPYTFDPRKTWLSRVFNGVRQILAIERLRCSPAPATCPTNIRPLDSFVLQTQISPISAKIFPTIIPHLRCCGSNSLFSLCSFVFFCGNNSLPGFLFRVFRLFRGLNFVFVFDCGSAAPGSFAAILPAQRPNRRPDIPFEYWSLEFDVSRHRTDGPVYAQF
jgi:hypothetical protein